MDQKILDQIGRDHARKYIHDLNPYVEPKSRKPKERIIRTHAEMYARDIVTGSDSIPEENTRKCISAADILAKWIVTLYDLQDYATEHFDRERSLVHEKNASEIFIRIEGTDLQDDVEKRLKDFADMRKTDQKKRKELEEEEGG